MIEFFKVILLGIIEGITEFLPVSSTGHLILVNQFISLEPKSFENAFNIIIQLGAILSVVVLYFKDLYPFKRGNSLKEKWELRDLSIMRLLAKIIVGVLPAMVLGFIFDDLIDAYLFNKYTVSVALVFYGFIIILMENRNKDRSFKFETIDDINLKTIFLIGCFQCLAMIPGTSRSAATIIGAMLLGASRKAAAEFSFFLAIPTMIGATFLKVIKLGFGFSLNQWLLILIGGIVSFLVAYLVITKFMGYIKKHNFKIFGYYRIILGIVVLIFAIIIK